MLRLLSAAAAQGLLSSDLFTIEDWVKQSGYADRAGVFALILALMLALDEGSLCVEASVSALTSRLADVAPEDAGRWAELIVRELDGDGLPALVGRRMDDSRPIILYEHHGAKHLYFHKHFCCESEVQQTFLARLQRPWLAPPSDQLTGVLREVLHEQPIKLGAQPLQLDDDQKIALGLGLLQNLTIISGGPGTGKTSIVLTLLRCLVRLGISADRITLAAPTGRAAQRLNDTLHAHLASVTAAVDQQLAEVRATTLHQALEYQPSRAVFRRHEENPISADVVIVDEVSMVGIELMARLFRAVAPEARLILLGDKDQLPSVDAGAVLAHLLPDEKAYGIPGGLAGLLRDLMGPLQIPCGTAHPLAGRVAFLRTNHRSQPDIRAAAGAINRQDLTLPDQLPKATWPAKPFRWEELTDRGGCWLWEPATPYPAELQRILDAWAEHAYLAQDSLGHFAEDLAHYMVAAEMIDLNPGPELDRLFARLEHFRLLTLLREGPWGAGPINDYLDRRLRPHLDRSARSFLFAGAPVLVTRNDHERGLFNGDVGLTMRSTGRGLRVVFRREGRYVAYAAESLPAHELGFALTVHKSQGSEYDEVLIVLPPEAGRRLLTKELIYTAVTRAKHLALLCGSKETLRFALGRRVVREAGLLGAK